MKWIVKRDIRRVKALEDVEIVDAAKVVDAAGKAITLDGTDKGTPIAVNKTPPHDLHLHRGAIIELGESANNDELQTGRKDDAAMKKLIAELRISHCIGDASDKEVVARVVEDIVTDARREAAAKKAQERADNTGLANAIKELLAKAASTAAPAK